MNFVLEGELQNFFSHWYTCYASKDKDNLTEYFDIEKLFLVFRLYALETQVADKNAWVGSGSVFINRERFQTQKVRDMSLWIRQTRKQLWNRVKH